MRYTLVELSPSGGLFQFSFQLGRELAGLGHRVELLTGPRPELTSPGPDFQVVARLPTWHPGAGSVEAPLLRRARRVKRAVQHVTALLMLVATLSRRPPDVLFWQPLRFPMDSWTVVLLRRLCPRTVLAVVLHEPRPLAERHREGSFYKADPVLDRSVAAALRRMDVIFVLGEAARGHVRDHWRTPASVEVIPHGDEGVFVAEGPVTSVEETGPRILFFGTWTRYKGIEVLLEAFRRVRRDLPDAELVLAGAVGSDIDFEQIRRTAASIGNVDLRPGYVAMSDVPALVTSSRVVAVPYLRASQSGVAHLAQTFGRPVVASRVGDVPTAVPDGVAGLLVPPDDAAALAEALRAILESPTTAARMGDAGRARLREEGSWPDIARRVAAATETAAETRRTTTGRPGRGLRRRRRSGSLPAN